ncbi:hypothetical protein [Legionella longbeachae]|uniref:hypothetical protein n=1 Tax=Legionella longbeachae TaxID=450 RepID=UPI001CD9D95E|nr:hypothetical protein [Legionella longbeachae]
MTNLIITSAKTGIGFAEFHDQLLDSLSSKHTSSADLKTSRSLFRTQFAYCVQKLATIF